MTDTFLKLLIGFGIAGGLAGICLVFLEVGKIKAARIRLAEKAAAKRALNGPGVLRREAWAQFEGTLPNLKQVIVVADIVERPLNGVLRAVEANLARGVRYSFIVSRSKATDELDGWIHIFQALAKIAIKHHNLNKKPRDLVQILALPDDWDNPPYVFYRVEEEQLHEGGRKNIRRTIAFRGNRKNVGIADEYEAMHPFDGDALATALNSGAPETVQRELADFQEDTFTNYVPVTKVGTRATSLN